MTTEYVHYALTAKTPNIACHGTSFPTLEDVRTYITYLQTLGLCTSYAIQGLKDGHWHLVDETALTEAEREQHDAETRSRAFAD